MKLESPRSADSITFEPDLISTGMIVDPVSMTQSTSAPPPVLQNAEILFDGRHADA